MIIDQVFDSFHVMVQSALDLYSNALTPPVTFEELYDNEIIDNNDNKMLDNGWCVKFEGDVNNKTELSGNTYMTQTVVITLTTTNFGTIRDVQTRKDAEKHLLKAKDSIVKATASNPQLDGIAAACTYENSQPVQLMINLDDKIYLMLKSTYTISYYEASN